MSIRFPGSRPPQLTERMLKHPGRYREKRWLAAMLGTAAKYYHTDVTTLERRPPPAPGGPTAAGTCARAIYEEVKAGRITLIEIAKGRFSWCYDNKLLAYARTGEQARQRISHFFYHAFAWLKEHKDFIAICADAGRREDAYQKAFFKFCSRTITQGENVRKGASILFRKIYRDQCHDEERNYRRHIRRFNLKDEEGLAEAVRLEDLLQPPVSIDDSVLDRFERVDPNCARLLRLKHLDNLTYAELAKKLAKPTSTVKGHMKKCVETLRGYLR